MSQASTTSPITPASDSKLEVLTLSEAAEYLRLAESEVIELTLKQSLPGRRIGEQWRFLRSGLASWLLEPSQSKRLLRHAGALPESTDTILEQIYRERGRSTGLDKT